MTAWLENRSPAAGRLFPGIDAGERVGGIAIFRSDLDDDFVLINRPVDRGDLALAESVVQVLNDGRDVETEPGGGVAIDIDHHLLAEVLLVRGDVGQFRLFLQFVQELVGPLAQFFRVEVLKHVLIARPRQPALDLDVLHRLQMQRDIVHVGDRPMKPLHDFIGRSLLRSGVPMSI